MSSLFDDAVYLMACVAIDYRVDVEVFLDVVHAAFLGSDKTASKISSEECNGMKLLVASADLAAMLEIDTRLDSKELLDVIHHSILNAIRRHIGDVCESLVDSDDDIRFLLSDSFNSDLPRIFRYIKASYEHAGCWRGPPTSRAEAVAFFKNVIHFDPFNEYDEHRFPILNIYSYNFGYLLSTCSFGSLGFSPWTNEVPDVDPDDIPF